jgi:hypothetical protein
MGVEEILALDESPTRTAALVEWIQGLYEDEDAAPILVGGAAVELYTTGAYTTGDLDLVGHMPAVVAHAFEEVGFERHGRHWIHETAQVFVELPGSTLDPEEVASWTVLEGRRVRVISVEDLLVDRLGAWEYWRSSVDGANAFLLWWTQAANIDLVRLEQRVTQAGWLKAYRSLTRFAARWQAKEPTAEEIEKWAIAGPSSFGS